MADIGDKFLPRALELLEPGEIVKDEGEAAKRIAEFLVEKKVI